MNKAKQFNRQFKVGDPALYTNDVGETLPVVVSSRAWNLPSGDALVVIKSASNDDAVSMTGGYDVDRIRANPRTA